MAGIVRLDPLRVGAFLEQLAHALDVAAPHRLILPPGSDEDARRNAG